MNTLYLASQSPRRGELLQQIGVEYQTLVIDVLEQRQPKEAGEQYVQRLALEKANAGWQAMAEIGLPEAPVLGADTIGVLGGQVFEKPECLEDALLMLRTLSGETHQILSAVAVVDGSKQEVVVVKTAVTFRHITDQEIERYWNTGEPQDKAGSYGIQGLGAVFVESINGSYSAVVGLPLMETSQLLQRFNVPVWDITH